MIQNWYNYSNWLSDHVGTANSYACHAVTGLDYNILVI